MKTRSLKTLLLGCLALGLCSTRSIAGSPAGGAVFVGTNHTNYQAAGTTEHANEIVMYRRATDGQLSLVGYFPTGGQGSGPSVRFAGDGLGSSHSVQLSQDHSLLFVTNAGSNSISIFRVQSGGLKLASVTPTNAFPNSVALSGNLVYVLCAAGAGSIQGYHLNSQNGTLSPISDSTRTISANQDPFRPDTLFNPAQVAFTPDGQHLVVSIKDGPASGALSGVFPTGPGRILVFRVNGDGRPSAGFTQTNLANEGPFGFSFDRSGNMYVATFVGGPFLTAAVRSFRIQPNGSLAGISYVNNFQQDSCWFENNGKYGWTANYTSGNISGYTIGNNGTVTLLNPVAGRLDRGPNSQGPTPLDLAVTPDGNYLYNVLPGSGKVAAFRINGDGNLSKINEYAGLPRTVNGDSAPFEFGPGGSPAGIAAY